MNRFIICSLLILVMSCHTDTQPILNTTASIETNLPIYNYVIDNPLPPEPYELKLELNTLETNVYDLVINMQLNNDSYYVSPHSKGNFKGMFSIIIDENTKLETIAKLIETPRSVEEYDPHPFVNGYVNWVRENTTYNQQLQRKSEKDFQVSGFIRFTIEPRCTLEQIPFTITYAQGEMKIKINRC